MNAERWRQRGLQLIYLSNPRHNRIGSHFCMYSCSPSSGALDSRVDPIDQESILGLDAREMNPMVSDHKALSSTILLWCNGLVPTCKWPSHSFLESPRFAAWLGRKENKRSFCYGLGWEWAQKQNISEFQLANTTLKLQNTCSNGELQVSNQISTRDSIHSVFQSISSVPANLGNSQPDEELPRVVPGIRKRYTRERLLVVQVPVSLTSKDRSFSERTSQTRKKTGRLSAGFERR